MCQRVCHVSRSVSCESECLVCQYTCVMYEQVIRNMHHHFAVMQLGEMECVAMDSHEHDSGSDTPTARVL